MSSGLSPSSTRPTARIPTLQLDSTDTLVPESRPTVRPRCKKSRAQESFIKATRVWAQREMPEFRVPGGDRLQPPDADDLVGGDSIDKRSNSLARNRNWGSAPMRAASRSSGPGPRQPPLPAVVPGLHRVGQCLLLDPPEPGGLPEIPPPRQVNAAPGLG
jgi:hypothetical protein